MGKNIFEWKLAVNDERKREYLKELNVFGKNVALTTDRFRAAVKAWNVSRQCYCLLNFILSIRYVFSGKR